MNLSIFRLPPESAGVMKISLWDDKSVYIENHTGIVDMKDNCIKIKKEKRIIAVNGEQLIIEALDGCNLRIKGKIFSIEYLT